MLLQGERVKNRVNPVNSLKNKTLCVRRPVLDGLDKPLSRPDKVLFATDKVLFATDKVLSVAERVACRCQGVWVGDDKRVPFTLESASVVPPMVWPETESNILPGNMWFMLD